MTGIFNIILMIAVAFLSIIPALFGIVAVPIYCLLVFFRASNRKANVEKKLLDTLMKNEEVLEKGIQLRPFAFLSRRKLIALTNSRIILISRRLMGGFTMKEFQWKDLEKVTISENILSSLCGSNLEFKSPQMNITIKGVGETASSIYSKAQAEEQAWEEKRRIRNLEEKRASAGGVIVHAPPTNLNNEASVNKKGTVTEEIEKAKKLLDSGAISDAEYQEIKSKILSSNF